LNEQTQSLIYRCFESATEITVVVEDFYGQNELATTCCRWLVVVIGSLSSSFLTGKINESENLVFK